MTSDEASKQCSSTRLCKLDGQCTFSSKGFGSCIANSVDDCHASTGCAKDGLCSLVDGRCVIATEKDCKQSEACTRKGLCSLQAKPDGSSACVLDKTSVESFCTEVSTRIDQMIAKCDSKPATKDLRGLLAINKEQPSCVEHHAFEVVVDKMPACLAELRTWHEAPLVILTRTAACRAAFKGKLALGAPCGSDLECPDGAWCTFGGKEAVCASPAAVGVACSGDECAPTGTCDHGKCAPRLEAGAVCNPKKQDCATGLTCLLDGGGSAAGKCGPLRKAGDACHRWTECEGACVTPNPRSEDGTCESFCGSG